MSAAEQKREMQGVPTWVEVISKLAIPVAVVILSLLWNSFESRRIALEKEKDLSLRGTEVFFREISGSDVGQKRRALAMLQMVDQMIAVRLSQNIVNDSSQEPLVAEDARKIYDNIMEQFQVFKPQSDQTDGSVVKVEGYTPFRNYNHYIIILTEGKTIFADNIKVKSNGSISGKVNLKQLNVKPGETCYLSLIATKAALRSGKISRTPIDALESSSVTVKYVGR